MTAPNQFRMRLDIRIEQLDRGGALQVSEELVLPPLGFLELAAVLGQFHEMAEQIKAAHAAAAGGLS